MHVCLIVQWISCCCFLTFFCAGRFVWVTIWHLHTMPEKNRLYKSPSQRQTVHQTSEPWLKLLEACREHVKSCDCGLIDSLRGADKRRRAVHWNYLLSLLPPQQTSRRGETAASSFWCSRFFSPVVKSAPRTAPQLCLLSPKSFAVKLYQKKKKFFNWFKTRAGYGLSIWAF